ncbi:MAG: 4Fe-4S binding protein [Spirochaetales bacterium]|nr:4Fe-4S binding protein [Spirochaetales bacterium]
MKNVKIAIVFFSATNVTKSCAEIIQAHLTANGHGADLFDVTPFAARSTGVPLEKYDGVIFGFPVYGDFPPRVINDWLPTVRGDGKPCAVFVTYGGRSSGFANFHASVMLRDAGFLVQCCAEFLGRHTFNVAGWNLLTDRPDERDFKVAREFAALFVASFVQTPRDVFTLPKPPGYDNAVDDLLKNFPSAERKWGNPVRFKECSMCASCEQECPAQAMNHLTGVSDPAKCIECMHCVSICPDKALKADDQLGICYPDFLKDWGLTEELISKKQSKIIT